MNIADTRKLLLDRFNFTPITVEGWQSAAVMLAGALVESEQQPKASPSLLRARKGEVKP